MDCSYDRPFKPWTVCITGGLFVAKTIPTVECGLFSAQAISKLFLAPLTSSKLQTSVNCLYFLHICQCRSTLYSGKDMSPNTREKNQVKTNCVNKANSLICLIIKENSYKDKLVIIYIIFCGRMGLYPLQR